MFIWVGNIVLEMEKFPLALSSVIVKMLRLSRIYFLKLLVFYGDMGFILTEFSSKKERWKENETYFIDQNNCLYVILTLSWRYVFAIGVSKGL